MTETLDNQAHEDLAIGFVLAGKYKILEKLGQGGMGIVYRANHLLLGRTVAVKTMHPGMREGKRFQNEAAAAASLNHPNIVAIHDFGLADRLAYLVMDFLKGETLDSMVSQKVLELPQFFSIFKQACAGLDHAHRRGVIHRDLKCSNLMLIFTDEQSDLFLKIVDFGLAKMISATGLELQSLTTTGTMVGTPLYMSPEQIRGLELDGRADIYSLGIVMYRSLNGYYPITGSSATDTVCKHLTDAPLEMKAKIPESLKSLILSCLEKAPNQRPASMAELARELEIIKGEALSFDNSKQACLAATQPSTVSDKTIPIVDVSPASAPKKSIRHLEASEPPALPGQPKPEHNRIRRFVFPGLITISLLITAAIYLFSNWSAENPPGNHRQLTPPPSAQAEQKNKANSDNSLDLVHEARIAAERQDLDRVKAIYKTLRRKDWVEDDNASAFFHLAELSKEKSNYNDAIVLYSQSEKVLAATNSPEAEILNNRAWLHMMLGDCYRNLHQDALASQSYQKAASLALPNSRAHAELQHRNAVP
jgi:serine/threonine protein kinase